MMFDDAYEFMPQDAITVFARMSAFGSAISVAEIVEIIAFNVSLNIRDVGFDTTINGDWLEVKMWTAADIGFNL